VRHRTCLVCHRKSETIVYFPSQLPVKGISKSHIGKMVRYLLHVKVGGSVSPQIIKKIAFPIFLNLIWFMQYTMHLLISIDIVSFTQRFQA
jgi:hypothetical protein